MYELINGSYLPVREYNGQRVITFKDIDTVHQRPSGTARKRFNDNKKHFIEGEDFFKVKCSEVRPFFGQTLPNGYNPNADIILVAESGYLMIVKSFTDDLSWNVQRQLVTAYFKAKEGGALPAPYMQMIEKRLDALESLLLSSIGVSRAPRLSDDSKRDYIAEFITECCTPRRRNDEVTCKALYDALVTYCHQKRVRAPGRRAFTSWLCDYYGTSDTRHFTKKSNKNDYYILTLTPAAKQKLGIV